MFEKHKAKKALFKAFCFYREKKKPYLKADTISMYEQLQEIEYAIAYVLCEYFDFNYEFYCDFPFNYKWDIAYDYIHYYDECKKAYETITKQNDTTEYNYIAWSTNDFKGHYMKGDTIYNIENGCVYMYDGQNFINMC